MQCSRTLLVNHLVSEQLDRVGNLDAERPGCLQINDELEFGRLQDRQVGWLGPLKDMTGVDADLMKHVRDVRSVTHQPASFHHLVAE